MPADHARLLEWIFTALVRPSRSGAELMEAYFMPRGAHRWRSTVHDLILVQARGFCASAGEWLVYVRSVEWVNKMGTHARADS